MTRDKILTALRCCAEPGRDCEEDCPMNEISREPCREVLASATADLIEAQAKEIDALRNELCLKCGNYKLAHKGACIGWRWRRYAVGGVRIFDSMI